MEYTVVQATLAQQREPAGQQAERVPLLRARGLVKAFSETVAVNHVDLDVERGQVVAVVGENGAGKSTLKNLLTGLLEPDRGVIELEGQRIARFHAADLGIAAVHQEFSLFPTLSVAENICIVDLPGRRGLVDWEETKRIAKQYLDMIGADLDLEMPVERLSTGEQQLVEIAKALRQATRLLILDEPTASLSQPERERLFQVIRRLRERGLGIIYISHFIDEVYEIADTAVVLRDGHHVGGGPVAELPRAKLEELMVGRPIAERREEVGAPGQEVALKVEGFTAEPWFRDISFELRKGEILGLSGLMGAGRTELVEAIYGLRKARGRLWVGGQEVDHPTPPKMRQLGVAFVPEDRRRSGLFAIRSLKENLTAAALARLVRWLIPGVGFRGEKRAAEEIAKKFRIVHAGVERAVRYLSGGNQQKALLARWLALEPRVLILDDPTRGVDIGAKDEIHGLIAQLARSGTAVLMVSSELPELLMLAHRIIVLRKGSAVAEFTRGAFDPKEIIRYAASEQREEGGDGHA
ncbi:MAG: sugar ABC transporter ATP-binding protein [Anaerolineae bacterium]